MLEGFQPILSSTPKVLILGSMPSVTSLEKHEYYGFKHNRFWKIMHAYFQKPISTYEEKQAIIKEHQLMVWDVIAMCEREGSLDSKIKNVTPNPIKEQLENYPSIEAIICNGKKSYDLFLRYFKDVDLPIIYLPSTSNANRTIKEEVLFDLWFTTLDRFNLR